MPDDKKPSINIHQLMEAASAATAHLRTSNLPWKDLFIAGYPIPFRELNDAQARELAGAIAAQVNAKAPGVNAKQFVEKGHETTFVGFSVSAKSISAK